MYQWWHMALNYGQAGAKTRQHLKNENGLNQQGFQSYYILFSVHLKLAELN